MSTPCKEVVKTLNDASKGYQSLTSKREESQMIGEILETYVVWSILDITSNNHRDNSANTPNNPESTLDLN